MISFPALQTCVSLRAFNTFGIDASAAFYLPVFDVAALQAVRRHADLVAMPRLVLGGGSNIVLDGDFPGLVLHMQNRGIGVVDQAGRGDEHGPTTDHAVTLVRAAAGTGWHTLVEWTLAHGFGGLENLALIPGSVGAAPIQNIGAYGCELKDRFHSLRAFDFSTGELVTLSAADCRFAYRDSLFKRVEGRDLVIVDVTFALPLAWRAELGYAELANEIAALGLASPTARQIGDAVIAIRRRKLPDPSVIGNAGSFFKNPLVSPGERERLLRAWPDLVSHRQTDGRYKLAAGWLIDRCGWKGRSLGRAGVYERQALVLVNRGGASGAEIMALALAIQDDVRARFGVELETEPVRI